MLDTDRHSSATAYDDDTVSHDPLPRHRCLGLLHRVRISLALHPYSNEPASSFPALTLGPHRMHVPRMHVPCMHVPCMHSMHARLMHARLMHALNATVKPKNQMPRHVSPRCVHRLRARRPHPLPPYTTCTRGGERLRRAHTTAAQALIWAIYLALRLFPYSSMGALDLPLNLGVSSLFSHAPAYDSRVTHEPTRRGVYRLGLSAVRSFEDCEQTGELHGQSSRAFIELRSQLLRTEPSSSCPCTRWQAPCAPRAARPQSAPTRPT